MEQIIYIWFEADSLCLLCHICWVDREYYFRPFLNCVCDYWLLVNPTFFDYLKFWITKFIAGAH